MINLRTSAAVGSAVAAVLLLATPAYADHEETPTTRELLEKCDNGTDSCVFHPEGQPEYFQGTQHQVGSPVFNCTPRAQPMSVSWSDTDSQSDSIGLKLEGKYGVVFKVGFSVSYGHEWKESHTEEQTTRIDVRSGEVGRVFRGPRMQRVKGTYEMRFPDRFHGHYIWYVPFEAVGPADEGEGGGVTPSTRAMTAEERAANCS